MASKINHWTPTRIARQDGKTFAITGANSGIGLEAAKLLAGQGGRIIMLCRSPQRAESAAESIRERMSGGGTVDIVPMDLGNMTSIREGAEELGHLMTKLDALICNAGVMAPPERQQTADGFEVQFGTNHLGHFLLSGLLSAQIKAADGRFVAVSSTMHKAGLKRIRFEDPNWLQAYSPASAYAQSKLANALFVRELNNRLRKKDDAPRGYICHPGYAATALQTKETKGVVKNLMKVGNALTAQSAARGSWPTVLCAADTEAVAGKYYGPTGMFELRGPVGECRLAAQALDDEAGAKLWSLSEELTGHSWTP